jgi:thiosulfate/3-mercaptopyruvate sulfurtransferase
MDALISTQALADSLKRADGSRPLRLFDATVHLRPAQPGPYVVESGRADYEAAHIPSAAFIDLGQELSDTRSKLRFTMPPVAHLEAALSAAGLSSGDDCVVYSSSSPMWATRLWWMLRSLGFDAAVLDGGLAKWRAEGRALTGGSERYPPGRFQARFDAARWADKDEVLRCIGSDAVCTINALTASVHAGTAELNYGRKGHIRGSVNVPYPSLLDVDGCFKPAAELHALFDGTGAFERRRVICYCGGGISATMDALALHRAGHADVAVYDGSLAEWARDPALPMALG